MPNTPRYPYATLVFNKFLDEKYKNFSATPADDPDGWGVRRFVAYDKVTSAFLAKVLPYIDDPRIVAHHTSKGVVTVEFASGNIADTRDPFPFEAAETVADAEKKD